MRFSVVKIYTFSFLLLAFLFADAAFAQNPTKWSLESDAKGKTLKSNEKFKALLKAEIDEGWHLYALEQPDGGPTATTIKIPENFPFKIDGKITTPPPITRLDQNFIVNDKPLETKFFEKLAEFNIPLQATADAKADDFAVNVRFQVCNDTVCLPAKTVKVTFSGFEDVKKTPVVSSPSSVANTENQPNNNSVSNNQQRTTNNGPKPTDQSLWGFLWIAASLGALSLLTPCVF